MIMKYQQSPQAENFTYRKNRANSDFDLYILTYQLHTHKCKVKTKRPGSLYTYVHVTSLSRIEI